jgi:hypothetical protein
VFAKLFDDTLWYSIRYDNVVPERNSDRGNWPKEMYYHVLSRNPLLFSIILDFDDVIDLPEVYLVAVEQNGLALQFIRACDQTLEIVHASIQQNPEAFQFILRQDIVIDLITRAVAVQNKN